MKVLTWLGCWYAQALVPLYSHGSPDCPCTNPWSTGSFSVQGNKTCLVSNAGECYPTKYGVGQCATWDSLQEVPGDVCSASTLDTPEWCDTPWCWVDPNNCARQHRPSAYFSNRTDRPTYSYQTCGYMDTYGANAHSTKFSGSRFRVAFPSDDDSGYTLLTDKTGQKTGAYVEFMNYLARMYNFTYVKQELSNSSRAKFPLSSYTACVHDVAINHAE